MKITREYARYIIEQKQGFPNAYEIGWLEFGVIILLLTLGIIAIFIIGIS